MPEENNGTTPNKSELAKASEEQKPVEAEAKTTEATMPPEDPIQEIVAQLRQAQSKIQDPKLAGRIATVVEEASDPIRVNQRGFQSKAAYAFQDTERQLGPRNVSAQARTLADRLATSVANLENERLVALMRATTYLGDQNAVDNVRHLAKEVSQQIDQNTPLTQERISQLDNNVRLASRPPATEQPTQVEPQQVGDRKEAATPRSTPVQVGSPTQAQERHPYATGNSSNRARPVNSQQQAPWQPAYTSLAGRLNAFQAALSAGRDDIAIRDAEKSAQAVLDALHDFRTGVGATVMNRVTDAARSEGLSTVLSEMREGGRYEGLRHEFDGAMTQEKGFARAYDQAASVLAQYGETRTKLEQVIANRPDAANLTQKFQKLDAEIGQAAEEIPSRHQGKNMLDDIGKRAGEIIQKAVQAIEALFNRNAARPGASGPSPGPR